MSKIKVYDKVSWHFPEGKNCPDIETAKSHFKIIMTWLSKNNLLTEEGKESYDLGIDDDFAITTLMLTDRGNTIFEKHYSKWLKKMDYENNAFNELDKFLML